jgi:hypothetical protein
MRLTLLEMEWDHNSIVELLYFNNKKYYQLITTTQETKARPPIIYPFHFTCGLSGPYVQKGGP